MDNRQIVREAMNLFLASPTGRGLTGGGAISGFAGKCARHLRIEWEEDDISYEPFERLPDAPFGGSAIYWYQKICKADIRINSNLSKNLIDISMVMAHEAGHHAVAEQSYFEQEIWCQIFTVWYYWDFVQASHYPAKRWRYLRSTGQPAWSPMLPRQQTLQLAAIADTARHYLDNRIIEYVLGSRFYKERLTVADVRRYFRLYGGPRNRSFTVSGIFIKHLAATGRFDDAVRILELLWHTMQNSHAYLSTAAGQPWKTDEMRHGWAILVAEADGIGVIRDALSTIIVPHYRNMIDGIGRYWGVTLLK